MEKTYKKRTVNKTCCSCDSNIGRKQGWVTKDLPKGEVMCLSCYQRSNSDYMNGKLDKNSKVGFGFIAQRVVAKVLGLELKNDCNCSIGFNAPYDLYNKDRYGTINVKGSKLHINYNRWHFCLLNKEIPDTYIMLGFDENIKNILHVWVTNPLDDLIYNKKTIGIKNDVYSGLKRAKPWEVDPKPYNNALHSMSLDNCSVLRSR